MRKWLPASVALLAVLCTGVVAVAASLAPPIQKAAIAPTVSQFTGW